VWSFMVFVLTGSWEMWVSRPDDRGDVIGRRVRARAEQRRLAEVAIRRGDGGDREQQRSALHRERRVLMLLRP